MTDEKNQTGTDNTEKTGSVRDSFLDVPTGAAEETEVTNPTPTPELDLDRPKKIVKKLKGIHIDEDVLDVFQAEQGLRERGWGSQFVSDKMREIFEQHNLFEKHNVKNLKKENN